MPFRRYRTSFLWDIGPGAQESVMRAVVANLVPVNKRGTGYGMFNLWFGIFWFLGSALMGYLYDISIVGLVIFSLVVQLISIPLFIAIRKELREQSRIKQKGLFYD